MPITDLVRYFNAADQAGGSLLRLESGRAAARHHDLRLTSWVAPIVVVRGERSVGRQASLQVWRADGSPAFTVDAFPGAKPMPPWCISIACAAPCTRSIF